MLLGAVEDEELIAVYNVADIFVMPNIPVAGDHEGFGIVILEAASCSLPVVAARLEGISDAMRDGEVGDLIAPGDAAGFTRAIVELLADDESRWQRGAHRHSRIGRPSDNSRPPV